MDKKNSKNGEDSMLMSLLGGLLGGGGMGGGGGSSQSGPNLQLSQINPQVSSSLLDMLAQAQTEETGLGKCPMCGGQLETKPGSTIPYCPYCGWTPSYQQTSGLMGNIFG